MRITVKNPKAIINQLKKQKKPFKLFQTMFTMKIETNNITYYSVANEMGLKRPELSFISMVKRFADKLTNIPDAIDRDNIYYIQPGSFLKNGTIKNCFEIDLTGAYWEFAKKNNYLNDKIHERGLTVRKKVRLIALGNLAKRTALIEFNGDKYLPIEFLNSKKTENVFFHVSAETDLLMRKLIVLSNNDFLFYWCDAIFLKTEEAAKRIIEYLEEENVKHKMIKIDKLIKTKTQITTFDEAHIKESNPDGKRVFNFKKTTFQKDLQRIKQLASEQD